MGSFPKNTQEGKQHRKPGKGKGEDFPISNRKKGQIKVEKGVKWRTMGKKGKIKQQNKKARKRENEKFPGRSGLKTPLTLNQVDVKNGIVSSSMESTVIWNNIGQGWDSGKIPQLGVSLPTSGVSPESENWKTWGK